MSSTTQTTAVTETSSDTATQNADFIPRGTVRAEVYFFDDPEDGGLPAKYVKNPPPGKPQQNYTMTPHQIEIEDVRGHESELSLDRHGFAAVLGVPTRAEPTFTDEEHIKSVYYPEVEQIILNNVPGATKVVIFDHTIRRGIPDAPRKPVYEAHIDQTLEASQKRVKAHVPDEAETLLKSRYRIINVWRPLNGPVQESPLAMAEASTATSDVLAPIDLVYPDKVGGIVGVRYNPKLKWHYLSGMTNDEVLLLKCSDSADVPGKGTPHTAFMDPRTPVGARMRESIEVRCLVFG
ncbi:hypothetical protein KEM52_006064 [Ascosphaera acerosa]|nr:hypothetical protein KEM52_006064 [Ascosphaera acerosa]